MSPAKMQSMRLTAMTSFEVSQGSGKRGACEACWTPALIPRNIQAKLAVALMIEKGRTAKPIGFAFQGSFMPVIF